jgi:hypothetical protein
LAQILTSGHKVVILFGSMGVFADPFCLKRAMEENDEVCLFLFFLVSGDMDWCVTSLSSGEVWPDQFEIDKKRTFIIKKMHKKRVGEAKVCKGE